MGAGWSGGVGAGGVVGGAGVVGGWMGVAAPHHGPAAVLYRGAEGDRALVFPAGQCLLGARLGGR